MTVINLQFQTPHDLAGFRKVVKDRTQEVNIKALTLTCACSQQELALAINYYGAKVVEVGESC